jgi:hypothetical protein
LLILAQEIADTAEDAPLAAIHRHQSLHWPSCS